MAKGMLDTSGLTTEERQEGVVVVLPLADWIILCNEGKPSPERDRLQDAIQKYLDAERTERFLGERRP